MSFQSVETEMTRCKPALSKAVDTRSRVASEPLNWGHTKFGRAVVQNTPWNLKNQYKHIKHTSNKTGLKNVLSEFLML